MTMYEDLPELFAALPGLGNLPPAIVGNVATSALQQLGLGRRRNINAPFGGFMDPEEVELPTQRRPRPEFDALMAELAGIPPVGATAPYAVQPGGPPQIPPGVDPLAQMVPGRGMVPPQVPGLPPQQVTPPMMPPQIPPQQAPPQMRLDELLPLPGGQVAGPYDPMADMASQMAPLPIPPNRLPSGLDNMMDHYGAGPLGVRAREYSPLDAPVLPPMAPFMGGQPQMPPMLPPQIAPQVGPRAGPPMRPPQIPPMALPPMPPLQRLNFPHGRLPLNPYPEYVETDQGLININPPQTYFKLSEGDRTDLDVPSALPNVRTISQSGMPGTADVAPTMAAGTYGPTAMDQIDPFGFGRVLAPVTETPTEEIPSDILRQLLPRKQTLWGGGNGWGGRRRDPSTDTNGEVTPRRLTIEEEEAGVLAQQVPWIPSGEVAKAIKEDTKARDKAQADADKANDKLVKANDELAKDQGNTDKANTANTANADANTANTKLAEANATLNGLPPTGLMPGEEIDPLAQTSPARLRYNRYKAQGGPGDEAHWRRIGMPDNYKVQVSGGTPRPDAGGAGQDGRRVQPGANAFETLLQQAETAGLERLLADKTDNPKTLRDFENILKDPDSPYYYVDDEGNPKKLTGQEQRQITVHLGNLDRAMKQLTGEEMDRGAQVPSSPPIVSPLTEEFPVTAPTQGDPLFAQAYSGTPIWQETQTPEQAYQRYRLGQFPGASIGDLIGSQAALSYGKSPAYGRWLLGQTLGGFGQGVAGEGVGSRGEGAAFGDYLRGGQRRDIGDIRGAYSGLTNYLRALSQPGAATDMEGFMAANPLYAGIYGVDPTKMGSDILSSAIASMGMAPGMTGRVSGNLQNIYNLMQIRYGPARGASAFADWVSTGFDPASRTTPAFGLPGTNVTQFPFGGGVPTAAPTAAPTAVPTAVPTAAPTAAPTAVPAAVQKIDPDAWALANEAGTPLEQWGRTTLGFGTGGLPPGATQAGAFSYLTPEDQFQFTGDTGLPERDAPGSPPTFASYDPTVGLGVDIGPGAMGIDVPIGQRRIAPTDVETKKRIEQGVFGGEPVGTGGYGYLDPVLSLEPKIITGTTLPLGALSSKDYAFQKPTEYQTTDFQANMLARMRRTRGLEQAKGGDSWASYQGKYGTQAEHGQKVMAAARKFEADQFSYGNRVELEALIGGRAGD